MASVTVGLGVSRTHNLKRKIRNFERRSSGAQGRIVDAAYRGILIRCPVQTGYLKSTIVKINTPTAGYVRVGAFYGIYVNGGTRNMAAQPFFTQGVRIEGVNQLRIEVRTLFA